jgi:uncharacterized protein YjbJ (UPF0337 family)
MIRRSTKDKREVALRELKGKIKEKVGHLTNNRDLEKKGI